MKEKRKNTSIDVLKHFQIIPGVGPSIAQDLIDLGFQQIGELKSADPEEMYFRLCKISGGPLDRCLLYVFKCAVYFALHETHDPELLKWWNWKDRA